MAMAFIPPPPVGGPSDERPPRKPEPPVQELSIAAETAEIERLRSEADAARRECAELKASLGRREREIKGEAYAQFKKREAELLEGLRIRGQETEARLDERRRRLDAQAAEILKRAAREAEAIETKLREEKTLAQRRVQETESQERQSKSEAVRESQKAVLMSRRLEAALERVRALEADVSFARTQAVDAGDKARAEGESAGRALAAERERAAELERKLKESGGRERWLEARLKDKSPAVEAGAKAPPSRAPRPVPPGGLQEEFDKLTGLRQGAVKRFFGWSRVQIEDSGLMVKVVQFILESAARLNASDVHLEPVGTAMRVRFRIDGMLEEVLRVPQRDKLTVISRIRVMSGLDPEHGSATAKPQEGRTMVAVDGKEVDLRLSTFPTTEGDKAVIRLIYRGETGRGLADLGFSDEITQALDRLIHAPKGMILVTGPTGCGKSTTLYALLSTLNEPGRNIVTLEDPVEMKIAGINQCAVSPKIEFTFASGLRAILRQDPNVIMVGEIRDPETAEIAMSASLTGHVLLSTLHTNSAAGAVARLLDMGLEPYLVASGLTAVFAQRLVRKICDVCADPYSPPKTALDELRRVVERFRIDFPDSGLGGLRRGAGCPSCRGTGYLGRVLLYELLSDVSGLRKLIMEKSPVEDIQQAALAGGMRPMLAHAFAQLRAGTTTLEEIFRVVGQRD